MTDNTSSGPPGPPWSVDVLADLHAGVLDPEVSAQLWPAVNADPEAHAVIEALDLVKVELGQLRGATAEPMPAQFAARLDSALDAEARRRAGGRLPAQQAPHQQVPPQQLPKQQPRQQVPPRPAGPVSDLAEARARRTKRMAAWGAGVLTAAAAAVAVAVASGLVPSSETSGNANPQARPPLSVDMDNPSAAIGSVRDERDYGPLENQQRLDECIRAIGLDPQVSQTIGVRQVMMDGRPGVYVLLTTGNVGQVRLLIVEPTCGPGNPDVVQHTLVPPG